MSFFDKTLESLHAELRRKRHLEAMLESMYAERSALIEEKRQLASIRDCEQRDVNALERISLSFIISSIWGNTEEKLSKERMEA